jgi:hypothetical protein
MLRRGAIVHDNAMVQGNTDATLGWWVVLEARWRGLPTLCFWDSRGYGVWEPISRHRRAEARRRHLMNNPF